MEEGEGGKGIDLIVIPGGKIGRKKGNEKKAALKNFSAQSGFDHPGREKEDLKNTSKKERKECWATPFSSKIEGKKKEGGDVWFNYSLAARVVGGGGEKEAKAFSFLPRR